MTGEVEERTIMFGYKGAFASTLFNPSLQFWEGNPCPGSHDWDITQGNWGSATLKHVRHNSMTLLRIN